MAMAHYFIVFLINLSILNFNVLKDSVPYDIVQLPGSIVKGRVLGYNDSLQALIFFNVRTADTDEIDLELINFLYYNSLPSSKLDTLFDSFYKFRVGKILFKSDKKLVFWDRRFNKIAVFYYPDFLNLENYSQIFFKNILFNPLIYLSLSFFSLLMAISLLLSGDGVNALIFLILMLFTIWSFMFLKSKIKGNEE